MEESAKGAGWGDYMHITVKGFKGVREMLWWWEGRETVCKLKEQRVSFLNAGVRVKYTYIFISDELHFLIPPADDHKSPQGGCNKSYLAAKKIYPFAIHEFVPCAADNDLIKWEEFSCALH
jgi:hypothetical protein